ncbi:MAG: imidazole glycerol phosphate synthase subunit HisH [Cytophagaceae bacterium]|jgi:glutamine amidotransferase|nr:imidazole glycerol phosphate synthase subunit HisH [Cytophagaceae bacterium]
MKIGIVRYNAGNTQSVIYALNRLGIEPLVTDVPEELNACDKIIFPGVGEASTAMQYLKERKLDELLRNLQQPILGICLGLQLMCKHSEENNADCLGIFPLLVKRFPDGDKVPQIGWNSIYNLKSQLFDGIPEQSYIYLVHSFYCEYSEQYGIASTQYQLQYSSALKHRNFYAVQFHAEKSGEVGSMILKNFIEKATWK